MEEHVTLGGNIQLAGFTDIEPASMIVLKKMVGNYARHFSTKCKKFELLKLTLKKVHEQEHSEKYEIHAMIVEDGKQYPSTVTEKNLFFAVDAALKKVENELK